MTMLRPNPIPIERFVWIPETRTYVAEASDLGPFGRVWDDACDEGLTLISARRNLEIVFTVEVTATEDNDILWWDLIPADRKHPVTFGVRVFND
jgi:hypothetical protein